MTDKTKIENYYKEQNKKIKAKIPYTKITGEIIFLEDIFYIERQSLNGGGLYFIEVKAISDYFRYMDEHNPVCYWKAIFYSKKIRDREYNKLVKKLEVIKQEVELEVEI